MMIEIGYIDLDNPIAIITSYQDSDPNEEAGLILLDGINLDRISVQEVEAILDELHIASTLGISVHSSEDRPLLDAARLACRRLCLLELDFSESSEMDRLENLIRKIKKCGTTLSLRINPADLTAELINMLNREGLDLIHMNLQGQNGVSSRFVKKIADLRGPKIMAQADIDEFEDARSIMAVGADLVSLRSPDPEFSRWLIGAIKEYDNLSGWYNAPKHICAGGDIRGLAFCCPPVKNCPVHGAIKKIGITPDEFIEFKLRLAKGSPLERGEGTCFGSLVWCCKISKPCYLRDAALDAIGLSGKEYMKLKRELAKELLKS
jgi:putative methanogenesis marker domain 9